MTTVAAILMVLGGLLSFANWWSVIATSITKRFHSAIPFFGAVLLGGGMLLIPGTRPYAWTALILDYGTLAFLLASPRLFREFWSTCRFNLIYEYVADDGKKTVFLRLFRRSVFTIQLRLHRPAGEAGLIRTGMNRNWERVGSQLKFRDVQESAVFEIIRDTPVETLRQSAGFTRFENSDELSLKDLEFAKNQT